MPFDGEKYESDETLKHLRTTRDLLGKGWGKGGRRTTTGPCMIGALDEATGIYHGTQSLGQQKTTLAAHYIERAINATGFEERRYKQLERIMLFNDERATTHERVLQVADAAIELRFADLLAGIEPSVPEEKVPEYSFQGLSALAAAPTSKKLLGWSAGYSALHAQLVNFGPAALNGSWLADPGGEVVAAEKLELVT